MVNWMMDFTTLIDNEPKIDDTLLYIDIIDNELNDQLK